MLTLESILRTTRQMTSYGEGLGVRKSCSGLAADITTPAREQTGALPQATSEECPIGGGQEIKDMETDHG